MLIVVDYGVGNLGSIANMLKRIGATSVVTGDPAAIREASKLILPGVGHFDHAMRALHASGLIPILEKKLAEQQTPLLGVCVGAQMLGRRSEEGSEPGLGWLAMDVVRFVSSPGLKIPLMGWREVSPTRPSMLFPTAGEEQRFYFVHSYHMSCDDAEDVTSTTQHGITFPASVSRGHIHGVQFHPEKSHRFGAALLRNFAMDA